MTVFFVIARQTIALTSIRLCPRGRRVFEGSLTALSAPGTWIISLCFYSRLRNGLTRPSRSAIRQGMSQATPYRREKNRVRRERTRTLLLDKAEIIFADRGYHSTRISDIVAVAEFGQGTFYRHFANKEAILLAILQRLTHRLLAGFVLDRSQLPKDFDTHRAVCLKGGEQAARVIMDHKDVVLLFLREGPSVGGVFGQQLEEFYSRLVQIAEVYLRHGVQQGYLRSCDAEMLAQAQIGQVLRILTVWLDSGLGNRDVSVVVSELVDFALIGCAHAVG